MILISHRGNIDGPKPKLENQPKYIQEAIDKDYEVEIDVWYIDNQFWLGHDKPQYKVSGEFLEHPNFWCHAKNIDALYVMNTNYHIHCFWHQEDDVTLTSRGFFWTYPGKELTKKSIAVLPQKIDKTLDCYGVCTDEVLRWA